MAFYIRLTKTFEDASLARYRFEGDGHVGALAIAKATGDVSLLEPVLGDEKGAYFSRAAAKIRKHWQQGPLPEATEWAS